MRITKIARELPTTSPGIRSVSLTITPGAPTGSKSDVQPPSSKEYERFEELMKRLVKVPKKAIQDPPKERPD